MILIVTYDLKTPRDYHDFYEALKSQADNGKWWHYMASTWILSTSKTPTAILEAVRKQYLDPQDSIFVCELSPNYEGWLPKPAWDWLKEELGGPTPVNHLAALAALTGKLPQPPRTLEPPPGYSKLADLMKPDSTAESINRLLGRDPKKQP